MLKHNQRGDLLPLIVCFPDAADPNSQEGAGNTFLVLPQ